MSLKTKTASMQTFSGYLRNDVETDDRAPQSVKRPRVVTPAVVLGNGASNKILKAVASMVGVAEFGSENFQLPIFSPFSDCYSRGCW
jgi:hypothetical protein